MSALHLRVGLVLAASAALAASGCGDRVVSSAQPLVPAGRLEGFVRMAVTPVEATVRATLVPEAPGDAAWFDTHVAHDGSYAMDVPAGRYIIGVRFGESYNNAYEYSAAGLRAGDAPPDTLRIDSNVSPVTVNFDLASFRVHLNVSPELDGQDADLVLHRVGAPEPAGDRAYLFAHTLRIQDGVVDGLVTGVLPGTYKVEVVLGRVAYLCGCPYDGERFWIPGVRNSGDSPPVELAPNSLAEVTGGVGPTPARIQGRISGAWQNLGLSAPLLLLFAPDSTVVRGARPVNGDGTFDERMYLPGPVKLLVSHDGIQQWIGGTNFAAATVYNLDVGRPITGIEFVESGARVDWTSNDSGFSFIKLQFYDAATLTLAAEWKAQYAPTRLPIAVPNLRPGAYRLRVDFDLHGYSAWMPQWYDRSENAANAQVVTIGSDGEVVQVHFVMQDGATISGTVHEIRGRAVDSIVYVTPADEQSVWGYHWANSAGDFRVSGVPNGRWKIGAWRRTAALSDSPTPPRDTVWYPGTTDWRSAHIVTIHDLQSVSSLDIVMPQSPP